MAKNLHKLSAAVLSFLLFHAPVVFAQQISNPAPDYFTTGPGTDFKSIILFFIKGALGIAGLLAVAFVIYGGFQYITSGGNEEQAEAGRKTLTNAIIGVVIVVLSYVIVAVISNALAKV